MKLIKLNFLLIAIVIQLVSCSPKHENWTVNVKIPDNKIEKAYLFTYGLSRETILIDSTAVSNQNFQFSAINKDDNPQVYLFSFNKNSKGGVIFIVKNEDKLSIDYQGEYKITYMGNEYADELNKYFKIKQQGVDILKEMITIYQNKDLTEEQMQKKVAGIRTKTKDLENTKLQMLANIKNSDLKGFLVLDEILTQSVIDKNIFEKFASLLHENALNTQYGKRVNYIMTHFTAYKLNNDLAFSDYMTIKDRYEALSKSDKESEFGVSVRKNLDKLEQLLLGKTPPDIVAKTIDGKAFNLKDIHSKLILIDFWASWCGPCRMENPHYKKLYNEFHPKGLTIIGYSLDTDKNKWKNAVEKDDINWINISNLKKQNEDTVLSVYQVKGIPANILVKDGVIVARNIFGQELDSFISNSINQQE